MSCAISFEISKARAKRSLGYQRSLADVPAKPMPSPSSTCPAYRTEKYFSIVSSSLLMPTLYGPHRDRARPPPRAMHHRLDDIAPRSHQERQPMSHSFAPDQRRQTTPAQYQRSRLA